MCKKAQLMAAKRADSVLVVDSNGELVGILTDKVCLSFGYYNQQKRM